MADRTFENVGIMDGVYAGTEFENSLSSELEVILAEVPFEKSADQEIWFSGDLTITFTVDNRTGVGPLETIVIRDTLDNTMFKYIPNSLTAQLTNTTTVPATTINLVLGTDFTVSYTSETAEDPTKDLLVISFLASGAAASIPVGSIATISFRGSKVPA